MQELYKETDAAGYVCMLSVDSDGSSFQLQLIQKQMCPMKDLKKFWSQKT